MELDKIFNDLTEATRLGVGYRFKIGKVQYEIIHVLTNKCKVKYLSGPNKDDETYLFNGEIRNAQAI